jgi:branched-chain amino acid transport system permease protein
MKNTHQADVRSSDRLDWNLLRTFLVIVQERSISGAAAKLHLTQSALVIIWVLVGGVGTLLGPIIGCFFVQWLTSYIGGLGFINPNLMLGAVLIGFVLLLPKGIVSLFGDLGKLFNGGRRAAPAEVRPASQGGKP